ncbi:cobalamin biosynthesis protein [Calothrix sp. PCC 6303]|uniref:cobalamin biosynthesis protein n=1 Tax=Calothrix sp. PCC 6303 TaxID=1170562 RepID=UPI0002A0174F|nr:cobalamin biosynthesis protein [Calothrix sp. PCC 6303]AFZ02414.1 cobalamin (vitamin B12) biosynthesis CbiG protein [Calothrix sp. PCC 6303]
MFTVGIGFRKGTTQTTIEAAIEQVFQDFHLLDSSVTEPLKAINQLIVCVASIDKKADEVALTEFCHKYKLPLKTFTAELLNSVYVPNPSQTTKKTVGSHSVAEAAAILAAYSLTGIANHSILVPKQIYSTVTIAVVQIHQT